MRECGKKQTRLQLGLRQATDLHTAWQRRLDENEPMLSEEC